MGGVAGARLEQDVDRGFGFVGRPGLLDRGRVEEAERGEGDVGLEDPVHDHRGEELDRRGDVGELPGDVEVEERLPLGEVDRRVAVGVGTVHGGEVRDRGSGEAVEQEREPAAGLLVLEGAGQEDRDVDLVDEQRRVEWVGHLRRVVALGTGLGGDVDVLATEQLVVGAGRVAGVDAGLLPALAVGLGLLADVLGPRSGEADVEDPAGGQGAPDGVVDDRQRSDRGQRRRVGRGDEQLGDSRVGEPDHADVVVLDPGLGRDGLDDVVAVGELERLEEVVGPAGAPRAPDVHRDDGVAHGERHHRRGLGRCVAGEGRDGAQSGRVVADDRSEGLRVLLEQVGARP